MSTTQQSAGKNACLVSTDAWTTWRPSKRAHLPPATRTFTFVTVARSASPPSIYHSVCLPSPPKARTRSLCPLSRSPRSPSQPAQRATRSASRAGRSLAPARANPNARARCLNLFAFFPFGASFFFLLRAQLSARRPACSAFRAASQRGVSAAAVCVSVCVREQGMGRVAAAASSAAAAAAAAACASVCVCAYSQEEEGGGDMM